MKFSLVVTQQPHLLVDYLKTEIIHMTRSSCLWIELLISIKTGMALTIV